MKKYFLAAVLAISCVPAFCGENEEAVVNAAAKVGENIGGAQIKNQAAQLSVTQSAAQKANLTMAQSGLKKDAALPPKMETAAKKPNPVIEGITDTAKFMGHAIHTMMKTNPIVFFIGQGAILAGAMLTNPAVVLLALGVLAAGAVAISIIKRKS